MSLGRRVPPRAARAAVVGAAALAAAGLASCGGDEVVERPAHRPISVVYVAGEPSGPWQARTEGLADGVKLAIAERDGLIGDRAVSTVVVPIEQRDGNTVSAAIGGGRILRDSRAIAVLGTYSAPQLALAAPQLNGGELSLLQYGTGMMGLIEAEQPGEPGRYQPSGEGFALRGVPSDADVATRLREWLPDDFIGAQVLPITGTYEARLAASAAARAKQAQQRREQAIEDGDEPPLPSTDPALTDPSPEVPDARRLANAVARAAGGEVVSTDEVKSSTPLVIITDPTEPDPSAAVRSALNGIRLSGDVPLIVMDGADRRIDAGATAGFGSAQYLVQRTIADATTPKAKELRALERKQFGRDRGDAVVAGYFAARRILDLAASQPERTIDRVTYARALTDAKMDDPNLPSKPTGDATLGTIKLSERRGGRWAPARVAREDG